MDVVSNEELKINKIERASKIICGLQKELPEYTSKGAGPFLAAIYDEKGNLVAKSANSVIADNCSNSHAEMNTIKLAQQRLKNYDLSQYNLSLYVTAEPCIMCLGGIMWSGIKNVYYGVPSNLVEKITGFDEGFKPNWLDEFKARGITVYGNIEVNAGINALKNYVNSGKAIYKPVRE